LRMLWHPVNRIPDDNFVTLWCNLLMTYELSKLLYIKGCK
jgi:hypothetical protein